MNKKILLGLTALLIGLPSAHARDEATVRKEIETARTVISEYVKTRQEIARVKNEWRTYRELAQRRIALYEREINQLREQLERSEEQTTQAEREISRIREEIANLREANAIVNDAMPAFEDRMREIAEYFPPPLRSKVSRVLGQLGRSRQASERMAVLAGIMNEVDQFNSEFTMDTDEVRSESGDALLVDVLYIGMAIGYYADRDGTIGGVLRPAAGGWERDQQNDLAPAIRRAMDYYSGNIRPANLVNLPFEIRDADIGSN
ncbi:MAG: DUF3450 family protein [Opitutales bacterium]|nr:DUF3450 family protein [Opitutales bacterium]